MNTREMGKALSLHGIFPPRTAYYWTSELPLGVRWFTLVHVILGILSDTHGKADMARAAVKLLIAEGAEYLIHCGDVGTNEVLDAMAGHPGMFVFGNNDWDRTPMEKYAATIGVVCGGDCKKLSFDGKLIIVTHGDDARVLQRAIAEQMVDYVFFGHSHQRADSKEGRVRLINPGALYRASEKTVATLDLQTNTLKFLIVNKAEDGAG